jgi:hypothetical protein
MNNDKWITRLYNKHGLHIVIRTHAACYEYYIAKSKNITIHGEYPYAFEKNAIKAAISHCRKIIATKANNR